MGKEAGPELLELRDQEMRTMSAAQRLQAVIDVLSLPDNPKPRGSGSPEEETGLVIQQQIFSRAWK